MEYLCLNAWSIKLTDVCKASGKWSIYFTRCAHDIAIDEWNNYNTYPKPKASFTPTRFSAPVSLRCRHRGQLGPYRSDVRKHVDHTGKAPLNSNVLKQRKLNGTHRGAKHRLFQVNHRSSSGMIRFSAVRPPGKTVVKPAWAVSKVLPRQVSGESRHIPEPCLSNCGMAR